MSSTELVLTRGISTGKMKKASGISPKLDKPDFTEENIPLSNWALSTDLIPLMTSNSFSSACRCPTTTLMSSKPADLNKPTHLSTAVVVPSVESGLKCPILEE